MTSTTKDPILVVIQLTGGNDYMNTVIPYADGRYHDSRPTVGIPADQVLPIDDQFGFNPALPEIKALYDAGKVAVVNGIGYPTPNRSHFRSMDIWHTCEPGKVGTEGWLGRVIRDLDPKAENVLTGVNFGRGLPRAMALTGVPVASVAVLETYGVLTGIVNEPERSKALDIFARMYTPTVGLGATMDYLGQTGLDALKGADILKAAPDMYTSTVEYAETGIARNLQGIAKVLNANLGTRVFYTQQGGYDTHASEADVHPKLLGDLSRAVSDFYADLREHDTADNVVMFVFTEFGRRVKDKRQRKRPRQRRSGLRHRRPGARRHVRRLSFPGPSRSGGGRLGLQHGFPRRVRHPGRTVAGPRRAARCGRAFRAAEVHLGGGDEPDCAARVQHRRQRNGNFHAPILHRKHRRDRFANLGGNGRHWVSLFHRSSDHPGRVGYRA